MDFLDKLILGKNTPLKSDSVHYPSKVYRNKFSKTNKDQIVRDTVKDAPLVDDWRFWCLFLAEPLDREKAFKNYKNIIGDLRLAIWAKLLLSEDIEDIKSDNKDIKSDIKDIKSDIKDIKSDINNEDINKIVERDDFLLKCVISKFRDYHEEEIFTVLRSVVDTHENIKNFVLLVDFAYHLVFMPLFDFTLFKRIFRGLFGNYKLDEMFNLSATSSKESEECKECKEVYDNNSLISKFEYLVYRDPSSLYTTLDILLSCNSTIQEVLSDDYTPTYRPPSPPSFKKETYFDFLIVQNENIKAQEIIKSDLMRIKKENEELRRRLS